LGFASPAQFQYLSRNRASPRGLRVFSYRVAGLSVASEIELPGALVVAEPEAPDARVRRAATPDSVEGATTEGPNWSLAGDRFLLRIPDVARFLIIGGVEILVDPAPGVDIADVAIFVAGTALGILLHQRGRIVMHASGVRVGKKAVLFCGPSGAGKSTLAAALTQRGYPVVTDDFCVVAADGAPIVHPDGRQLKLWARSIDELALAEQRAGAVRARLEKFYVEPPASRPEPMPLGAIYGLREARPGLTDGIERPNVVDAAKLLRRNAYRPLLVHRLGQKSDYFLAAAKMANAAGIFWLTRPLDFAFLPGGLDALEAHWREIGLLG